MIFNLLDYRISFPTEPQFLERFIRAGQADLESEALRTTLFRLAYYYCESTLLDYHFTLFKPSTVGLSSVVLALYTLRRRPWTPTLEHYSEETWTDPVFRQCVRAMQECILHPHHPDLTAIQEKYGVGQWALPEGLEMPLPSIFDV